MTILEVTKKLKNMKKTLFFTFFILVAFASYSQEQKKELSEAEKQQLRNQHEIDLNFSSQKKTRISTLETTNTSEEKDNTSTKTSVKYYYGKEDSLYKEFEYQTK